MLKQLSDVMLRGVLKVPFSNVQSVHHPKAGVIVLRCETTPHTSAQKMQIADSHSATAAAIEAAKPDLIVACEVEQLMRKENQPLWIWISFQHRP